MTGDKMRDLNVSNRDLSRDLAICNAATPGPWALDYDCEDRKHCVEAVNVSSWGGGVIVADCAEEADARFIAEARTGWPTAIERALEAEALLESHGPDGRNYTNSEYVEMRDRVLRAEAEVARLTSNCRALFGTLMEALEYVPGEIDSECRQIIARIRADIYGEGETE